MIPLALLSPFIVIGLVGALASVLFEVPFRMMALSTTWPGRLALVAGVVAVHFGTARLYAWQVGRTMRLRAAVASADDAGEAAPAAPGTAVETSGAASDQDPPPLPAPPPLQFVEHAEDAVHLTDTRAEAWVRDRLLNLRGRAFFRGTLVAWAVSLGLSVALTGAWAAGSSDSGWLEGFVHVYPHAAALLVLLLGQRFTVGIGLVTAGVVGLVANIWNFMFAVASSAADPADHPLGRPGFAVPLLAYAAVVALAVVVSRRRYPAPDSVHVTAPRLLVLRVFGADRTTGSLFRAVGRRWPMLGPSVTIADPTYSIVAFRHLQNVLLAFCMAPLVILVATAPTPALMVPALFAGFGFYLAAVAVALVRSATRARYGAGRNLTALRQKLAFETSALRRGYPSMRLTCLDDMWKPTVQSLVHWADVVLVDVRGFTAERKGVEFELGLLVDTFPLDHTVFLVDGTTDLELLRTTLSERWRAAAASSPNRASSEATAHLYTVPEGTRGVRREVAPLVSLLAEVTADLPSRADEADEVERARAAARVGNGAVILAWAVVAFGVFAQVRWEVDGIVPYSGMSIIWVGVILLMLASRVRHVLSTDGTVRTLFDSRTWTAIFLCLVVGWGVWYWGMSGVLGGGG